MHEARRRFQAQEYYVPEMLLACRAMKAAMNQIRPRLVASGFPPTARVCVISLAYQPEDATGWLVADILEGSGFEVIRSTLAVAEANLAEQCRTAEVAVVVFVAPMVPYSRGSTWLHSPIRAAVERLCRDCGKYGSKTILVGGDLGHGDESGVNAHVDDFADVEAVVERMTQGSAPA